MESKPMASPSAFFIDYTNNAIGNIDHGHYFRLVGP